MVFQVDLVPVQLSIAVGAIESKGGGMLVQMWGAHRNAVHALTTGQGRGKSKTPQNFLNWFNWLFDQQFLLILGSC